MIDPVLPIALAFGALALVCAQLPVRDIFIVVAIAASALGAVLIGRWPLLPVEPAFALCCVTVAATAGTAIIRPLPPRRLVFGLAAAIGIATACIALASGHVGSLLLASPAALVLLLATLRRWQGLALVTRILAAWLLAISLLSAVIPLVATPGYRSDHRE